MKILRINVTHDSYNEGYSGGVVAEDDSRTVSRLGGARAHRSFVNVSIRVGPIDLNVFGDAKDFKGCKSLADFETKAVQLALNYDLLQDAIIVAFKAGVASGRNKLRAELHRLLTVHE